MSLERSNGPKEPLLQLVALGGGGLTDRRLAELLGVSESTVKRRLRRYREQGVVQAKTRRVKIGTHWCVKRSLSVLSIHPDQECP